MTNARVELFVGFFLVVGFLALGWLALQLGEVPWLTGAKTYLLHAEFNNISGVKPGADVQIAGVTVGKVRQLHLNEDRQAVVTMQIDREVVVPVDSIASVKSQGIIGDKYIQITLGGDETAYKPGEAIVDTESAVDLESLISKFAFGEVKK
ncbi:Mammalian cell entry related domain protein [Desulfobulbus propionicus DSM 2032]|jgi:phospholipid/cholesterol/gamma-HCH transport system substrate-binding protein|uniref:Mammalian cell entry related domain protein n=1 Tax=Desulfobulbus propionicus (strain ATCC 33891 / DSM 2032 / VKM B-1956 / 1pr3) TaxID=577650 RepID=A0A7U3YML9_DESPD|nr:outer membrane lipid asymmetry maintenance protein MlaD [Desulfobulbus propionicus]ADW18169.1 Mammalian cell entry related domain protein [Desulfobulbus propionicus DSM 2032]